jgi:flagellar motor switch protein FliN
MAKKTEEEIDLDNLDDLDLDDTDFDLGDFSVDLSSTDDNPASDDDLGASLDDFDLNDDAADGDLLTDIDNLDDLDLEAGSDFLDDGDIDTQSIDIADEAADSDLDLSSLEDELGLAASDRVEAPSVQAIKDVESDDELERELASLGQQIDDASDDDDLLLDDQLMDEDVDDALGLDDEDAGLPMDDDPLIEEDDSGLDGEDLSLDDQAESSVDDSLPLDNSQMDTDFETDALDDEIAAGLDEDFDDVDDGDSGLEIDDDGLDGTDDLLSEKIDEAVDDSATVDVETIPDDFSVDEEFVTESPTDGDEATLEPFAIEDEEGPDLIGNDEASLILDETMEIKTIEPEPVIEEKDESEMDMLGDFTTEGLETDESGLFEAEPGDDDVEDYIELDEISEKDDFDLGSDLFGAESVDESLIEIGDPDENDRANAHVAISAENREDPPLPKDDTGHHTKIGVDPHSQPPAGKTEIIGQEMLFSLPHLLTVEIGKASLKGAEIMNLTYGSVIELDKKLGEPVDIVLGNRKIARGEVVQINEEQLGVRITRISD